MCACGEREQSSYARIKTKSMYFFCMAHDYFRLCNISSSSSWSIQEFEAEVKIKISRLLFCLFFFLPFHRLCVLVKVKGLAASEIEFLNTYAVQVYFRQMLSFSDCPASDLNPDLEGQLNLL